MAETGQEIANTPLVSYRALCDLIGNALRQQVRLNLGADGVSHAITAGQKTMADSVPVVLASDQPAISLSPASITASAPTAATVGVASGLALGPGTYKQIIFTITSAANVSLGFDATAVLNSGVTMIGRGGSFVLEGPITLATGVNAIASVAATNLAIQAFT